MKHNGKTASHQTTNLYNIAFEKLWHNQYFHCAFLFQLHIEIRRKIFKFSLLKSLHQATFVCVCVPNIQSYLQQNDFNKFQTTFLWKNKAKYVSHKISCVFHYLLITFLYSKESIGIYSTTWFI